MADRDRASTTVTRPPNCTPVGCHRLAANFPELQGLRRQRHSLLLSTMIVARIPCKHQRTPCPVHSRWTLNPERAASPGCRRSTLTKASELCTLHRHREQVPALSWSLGRAVGPACCQWRQSAFARNRHEETLCADRLQRRTRTGQIKYQPDRPPPSEGDFGKMGTIHRLLRGVPLPSTHPSIQYLYTRVRPPRAWRKKSLFGTPRYRR